MVYERKVYETIIYDSHEGFVELTLNRPQALNTFNSAMHTEVADAVSRVKADKEIRALPPRQSPCKYRAELCRHLPNGPTR